MCLSSTLYSLQNESNYYPPKLSLFLYFPLLQTVSQTESKWNVCKFMNRNNWKERCRKGIRWGQRYLKILMTAWTFFWEGRGEARVSSCRFLSCLNIKCILINLIILFLKPFHLVFFSY